MPVLWRLLRGRYLLYNLWGLTAQGLVSFTCDPQPMQEDC